MRLERSGLGHAEEGTSSERREAGRQVTPGVEATIVTMAFTPGDQGSHHKEVSKE